MRPFIAGLLLLGPLAPMLHSTHAAAHDGRFPYEAVVDADSEFVYSGPGKNYYPTSRLSQGERVTVRRHDPGGWYMIEPPPGSFSWIRADAVDRTGGQRGVLTDNNVVALIGSALEDSRDVFQTKLSTGATVEVIGEQTVRTERGPVRMLKIAPPHGEWRWIPGRSVTPLDQVARRRLDSDPYEVPSHARRHGERKTVDAAPVSSHKYDGEDGPAFGRRTARRHDRGDAPHPDSLDADSLDADSVHADPQGPALFDEAHVDNDAVRRRGPVLESLRYDRDRLRQLDDEFRAIIELDTGEWEFSELKRNYRHLQRSATHPALASQVELRLASLKRYEQIKADYDEFLHMTARISRRDARLVALQQQQLSAVRAEPAVQPISHTYEQYHTQPGSVNPLASPAPRPVSHRRLHEDFLEHDAPAPQPLPPHSSSQPPAQFIQHSGPSFQPPIPATPTSGQSGSFSTNVGQPAEAQHAPQLRGAGIIQRAASPNPHAPQHVLLAPNGRILAYLQATAGVNLDQHLGRPMGIRGARLARPDLQMDVFVVQSLTPVNLQ